MLQAKHKIKSQKPHQQPSMFLTEMTLAITFIHIALSTHKNQTHSHNHNQQKHSTKKPISQHVHFSKNLNYMSLRILQLNIKSKICTIIVYAGKQVLQT